MNILGIDYGKANIGLSLARSLLAEPYAVIRVSSEKNATEKIFDIIKSEEISKIVIGLPEGEIKKDVISFSKNLKKLTDLDIYFQDEALSTRIAQTKALEAKINTKKRRKLEDAYAATIILQDYLDAN